MVSYHYESGFPNASKNETSGDATWCHISKDLFSSWQTCVSSNGGSGGMCAFTSTDKNGAAVTSFGKGLEGVIGVLGFVVFLQNLL